MVKPGPAVARKTVVMPKAEVSRTYCAFECTNNSQVDGNLRLCSNSVVHVTQMNLAITDHMVACFKKFVISWFFLVLQMI